MPKRFVEIDKLEVYLIYFKCALDVRAAEIWKGFLLQ